MTHTCTHTIYMCIRTTHMHAQNTAASAGMGLVSGNKTWQRHLFSPSLMPTTVHIRPRAPCSCIRGPGVDHCAVSKTGSGSLASRGRDPRTLDRGPRQGGVGGHLTRCSQEEHTGWQVMLGGGGDGQSAKWVSVELPPILAPVLTSG